MCYSGYKVGASLCFKSGNGEFAIPLTEELVHFISASGNGCCERELFNAAISTMQPQDWSIFISTCGEFIPQEIVQIVEDNFAKLGSS